MALIACTECGNQLSDRASACPKCGCPIERTQTIEQTGKGWKALQLVGAPISIVGVVFAVISAGKGWDESIQIVAILILILGLLVFSFGRVGAFWYHG